MDLAIRDGQIYSSMQKQRSIEQEQTAIRDAVERRQAQQATEAELVQQFGLPSPGSRVTSDIGQITGMVQAIEPGENGGYLLHMVADDGEEFSFDQNTGATFRPEAAGNGTSAAPLKAEDARNVDAARLQTIEPNRGDSGNSSSRIDDQRPLQKKKGNMSRYLFPMLIAAGIGYWAYSKWEDHVELGQRQQAAEVRRQALKDSVIKMISKANAVTNWASNLVGKTVYRQSPVFTAELQEQWVVNRPIFLLGNIGDISKNSDGSYQIIVEYSWLMNDQAAFLGNEIRMNLRCAAAIASPLVQAAKEKPLSLPYSDTAVIALVDRIVTTSEKDSAGEPKRVLTGVGECLDAMHLEEGISMP